MTTITITVDEEDIDVIVTKALESYLELLQDYQGNLFKDEDRELVDAIYKVFNYIAIRQE